MLITLFVCLTKKPSVAVFGIVFSFIPTAFFSHSRLNDSDRRGLIALSIATLISFVYMLAIYYSFEYSYGIPYYLGGNDDLFFETTAQKLADRNAFFLWDANNFEWFKNTNSKGYLLFLARLIKLSDALGGFSTFVPRILNIYLLLSCAILVATSTCEKTKYLFIAFLCVSLFPHSLFISSFVFRDTICAFFLCLVFWIWKNNTKFTRASYCFKALITILILICSYFLRSIIVIFELLFITGAIYGMLPSNKKNKIVFLFITFLVILAIFVLFWDRIQYYVHYYSDYLNSADWGLSSYIFRIPFLPFGIIARFLLLLVSPVPTNLVAVNHYFDNANSAFGVLNSIGTIFQIYILFYFFKRAKKLRIDSVYCVLILLTITVTFTFRHFILYYPFLIVGGIEEISQTKSTTRKRAFCYTSLSVIVSFAAFVFIKVYSS